MLDQRPPKSLFISKLGRLFLSNAALRLQSIPLKYSGLLP